MIASESRAEEEKIARVVRVITGAILANSASGVFWQFVRKTRMNVVLGDDRETRRDTSFHSTSMRQILHF